MIREQDFTVDISSHAFMPDKIIKKVTHVPSGLTRVAIGSIAECNQEVKQWIEGLQETNKEHQMTTEIKIAALANAIKYKDNIHYSCPMSLLEIVAVFEAYLSGDTTQAVALMGVLQERANAKQKESDPKYHEFVL